MLYHIYLGATIPCGWPLKGYSAAGECKDTLQLALRGGPGEQKPNNSTVRVGKDRATGIFGDFV